MFSNKTKIYKQQRKDTVRIFSFDNITFDENDNEMNSSAQNISIADYYFGFLQNLNADSKLDLISKLSQSLKQVSKSDNSSLQSLFGSYQSEETAEEIIAEIRASRVFNHKIETL